MPVCIGGNSPVNKNVLAIAFVLELPQADVFQEHTHRSQPRQHRSAPAVEDAESQNVHTEEAGRWTEYDVPQMGPAAALGQLFGAPRSVAVQFFEVVREIAIRRMDQRGTQLADVGAALQMLVHAYVHV